MSQVVIGTAGHIDHGKSALVKALTGTDTDRLEEEKSRGMTIDLGFAFLNADITMIDVPGHEKFIRNMVAGVATIHIGLLVIAADDGIMPQTREHVEIMDLLGVKQGVIVITKTDLTDDEEWLDLLELDIRETFEYTFLQQAPLLRTSVQTGQGVEKLKETLLNLAGQIPQTEDRGFLRIPVDRVFSKAGFGTIITGTVLSGNIIPGMDVECLPLGKTAKVRGLQSHGQSVSSLSMGDRAAVNLAGIDIPDLSRGSVLSKPGWLQPTGQILARVTLLNNTSWEIKNRQRVRLHFGTVEVLARTIFCQESRLKAGDSTTVIFKLEQKVTAATDDRLIVRSYSPMDTIGGGQILDPLPSGSIRELKTIGSELPVDASQRLIWWVRLRHNNPQPLEFWMYKFQRDESSLQQLYEGTELTWTAGTSALLYHPLDLDNDQQTLLTHLEEYHAEHPYRAVMNAKLLRLTCQFSEPWFDYIITQLRRDQKIRITDQGVALPGHAISLSESDRQLTDRIYTFLSKKHYEPSTVDDIKTELNLTDVNILELLHVLRHESKAVDLKEKIWFAQPSLTALIDELRQHFQHRDELTVAHFKEITGLTRKLAIPFLEYLDKSGITLRSGNVRLRGKRLDESHG